MKPFLEAIDVIKAAFAQNKRCERVSRMNCEKKEEITTLKENGLLLDLNYNEKSPCIFGLLDNLYNERNISNKIQKTYAGEKVNFTEERPALHVALRTYYNGPTSLSFAGEIPETYKDLARSSHEAIKVFSESIRSGEMRPSGKKTKEIIVIGIGGSYLGTQYVYHAMKSLHYLRRNEFSNLSQPKSSSSFLPLHFLANVDPINLINVHNSISCLKEELLVVVVSKTFTTKETLLNLEAVKKTLQIGPRQIVAIASADSKASENINFLAKFDLWDWVGGRFSVSSAVGLVPLSLAFSYTEVCKVLEGAAEIDEHFFVNRHKPFSNIPAALALLDVFNRNVRGIHSKAILPYSEMLAFLPAHIQQLEMESNGKGCDHEGLISFPTGFTVFGEVGTKGQHSFYQSLHQGEMSLCDFIGIAENPFVKRDNSEGSEMAKGKEEIIDSLKDNWKELYANFAAQPKALFDGEMNEDFHKHFKGKRPSNILIIDKCSEKNIGRLLSIYEHRIEVQGFLWGINSFDQMGVQLGKKLAAEINNTLEK